MAEERIDILQEFVDLYAREEMLAFFDFTLERAGRDPISGLCRISKPKSGRSKLQYLSLTFVVDTPDDDSRTRIRSALEKLDGEAMKEHVPAVVEVVPVPSLGTSSESYVTQADILLNAEPDEKFVSTQLVPAVRALTELKAAEVVWWGDRAAAAAPGKPAATPGSGDSLVANLRRMFGRHS